MNSANPTNSTGSFVPIKPACPGVTLVHHFLEGSARLFPSKVALIHGSVCATYSEINNRADNLAYYLISQGVHKGDRVALLMENCLEYVVSYYGIMKAGAVAVPLNSDLKPEGLRYAVSDLEATCMISGSRCEKLISESHLHELGLSRLVLKSPAASSHKPSTLTTQSMVIADFDGVASASPVAWSPESPTFRLSWEPVDPMAPAPFMRSTDLASIIYTSGSTGGPKGVMLSHQNIVDNTFSICQYLRLTEGDIQMVVLPFSYVMGKSVLNTHFAVGGSVVINNQFAYPAAVLKEMVEEKVTGFSGVPSTFAYLVHRSPLAAMRDQLASLRYVSQAGGHMSKTTKEELRRILPAHTDIVIMYGATEAAARLSYVDPSRFGDKMDSIGKAIPGVRLKVVKEDGADAPAGEVGELVASGTNIMQGYWRNRDGTERALINGWYRTGDLSYVDEEGFFFVVGRKDNLLKTGGHRLNPQEVEDILMESGLLVEVVVLGLPDELLGNRLVALAVPTAGDCTSQGVLAYCAAKLPKFKVPSEVRFTRSLTKKASGKTDREACLALLSQLK
jgi:long-chain acyl-CoA synthetase